MQSNKQVINDSNFICQYGVTSMQHWHTDNFVSKHPYVHDYEDSRRINFFKCYSSHHSSNVPSHTVQQCPSQWLIWFLMECRQLHRRILRKTFCVTQYVDLPIFITIQNPIFWHQLCNTRLSNSDKLFFRLHSS